MQKNVKNEEVKVCELCGKRYKRPVYKNGRKQSMIDWKIRRFCGHGCSGQNHGAR